MVGLLFIFLQSFVKSQMIGIPPAQLYEDGLEESYEELYRIPLIRNFRLGALYNIYREKLYTDNLYTTEEWKNCKNCIETKHGIEDTTTFKFSHTKEDKMDMFDMSGHAKLSVMFDVVKLGSSFVGKYLKESTSSLDQIRFSYVKNEVLYTTFIG